jgi:O-antigen/teichoic acid export membrane protein
MEEKSHGTGLRKTGLTVFGSRLLSIFSGLAFLLIMTHSLNPSEFGLWEFIVDLVTFSSYPAGLVAFWATRKIARGMKVGGTAVCISLLLSVGGIIFFLVSSVYLHSDVGSALSHFLLATVLVPLSYFSVATNAVVAGYKPIISAYSLLVSEVCKLVLGYLLIVEFAMGIDGVIVSIASSYLSQSLMNLFMARNAMGSSINFSEGKEWLSNSWVPALSSLAYILYIADTFFVSIMFAGTSVVGYYQAAFSLATIVAYSGYLATALYPMLLRGDSGNLPSVALDFTLLFGIPLAVGTVVLAKPLLFVLKPVYVEAQGALFILSVSSLLYAIAGVIDYTLMGSERVDLQPKASPSEYIKSNLAFVPITNLVSNLLYLGFIVFFLSRYSNASIEFVLELWAAGQLIVLLASVLFKALRASRNSSLHLTRNVLYYLGSSAAMGSFAYFGSSLLNYSSRSLFLGLELTLLVCLAACIYFLILYTVDSQFKLLLRRLMEMIR